MVDKIYQVVKFTSLQLLELTAMYRTYQELAENSSWRSDRPTTMGELTLAALSADRIV
jgi:hypothetical protein